MLLSFSVALNYIVHQLERATTQQVIDIVTLTGIILQNPLLRNAFYGRFWLRFLVGKSEKWERMQKLKIIRVGS